MDVLEGSGNSRNGLKHGRAVLVWELRPEQARGPSSRGPSAPTAEVRAEQSEMARYTMRALWLPSNSQAIKQVSFFNTQTTNRKHIVRVRRAVG